MSLKDKIIEAIILREGGYVNHPDDGGGETNYGITKVKAKEYGYTGSMKLMTYSFAKMVYEMDFWKKLKLSEIEKISPLICEEIADTAVNVGQKRAIEFLQECLNALNNKEKLYQDIKVDGVIGQKTLHTLSCFFDSRELSEEILFFLLNARQAMYYFAEASEEKNDKHETFFAGWVKERVLNRISIKKAVWG